jgi:HEAT repeat protein
MRVDYVAPDPAVAELVYRNQEESERQHRRLTDVSSDLLKAVARDHNEPEMARANAFLFLLMRRDPEMPGMLLELFEDPNQQLWPLVVRSYRPDDQRVKEKLRRFLDDSHERSWSEAAVALARLQDRTILPRLENWLRASDSPHRNVAIECLKTLDRPEARFLLRDFWDRSLGDEEDRLIVAAALLTLGDPRGLVLLESAAHVAKGSWSVFAATSIYAHDFRRGLELMLGIIDVGDLEAQQSLVSQIWNLTGLPHAFTADGIHEARVWIESQLAGRAI